MPQKNLFNSFTQFALPFFTLSAQVAIALKFPQWGLILGLTAQPFWIYSGIKAYKQAGQSGILINSIIFTMITIAGVINYWLL